MTGEDGNGNMAMVMVFNVQGGWVPPTMGWGVFSPASGATTAFLRRHASRETFQAELGGKKKGASYCRGFETEGSQGKERRGEARHYRDLNKTVVFGRFVTGHIYLSVRAGTITKKEFCLDGGFDERGKNPGF
jgi:hypothetical protein